MKAYKGFDENMQCRGFQYEEGKTYETDKADTWYQLDENGEFQEVKERGDDLSIK